MDLRIQWLPDLYILDNRDNFRVFRAGYSKGMFHSETGLLYKKDGSAGKLTQHDKPVKQKTNTNSPLAAAKLHAEQEWDEKIRIDKYRESDVPPAEDDVEEWKERALSMYHYPAVSKAWDSCNEEVLSCSPDDPWYGQAKVNGDRLTCWFRDWKTKNEVVLYSRNLLEKPFLDAIRQQSALILKYIAQKWPHLGEVGLDGEVYAPSMRHHQDSRSSTSRTVNRSPDEHLLVFHIFDVMEYTLPFSERAALVDQISARFGGKLTNVAFLGTSYITSDADVRVFFKNCADAGFDEGIILRRGDLLYTRKSEYKHCDMVKMKKEEDGEFLVVGYKEGEGSRAGCVVWHLQDPEDASVTFWSVMLGHVEDQQWYFNHAEEFMDRLATVKYSEKSKDNVPKMPVVTHFRDEGDLPRKQED